jgi:murein DD-endopeptidase MepM/ murein hydrolase activator NlpD
MKKRRIVAFLLIIIILSLNVVQAYGETVDELRKRQKDINNRIDKTNNEIKSMQSQTKDISKQIEELDLKIDGAATELSKVENELDKLRLKITETEKELNAAEEKLAEQEDTFNQRLRVMYKNGNVGYLEVLLSSGNIKDFLSRKDMIQSIAEYDKDLIRFMKEQRDIIDQKKTELEAQRASVEVTKSKIEARKKNLESVSREKELLMSKLQKDIKAYEKEYDKLNEYAKSIESKIVKLQRNTNPYTGGKMSWPVPGHSRISSYYGYRIHPIFKTKKLHTGVDIPAPTGTAVKAAADGIVIHTDWLGGYGKAVMVDHGSGIVTLYGHNSAITVKNGTNVKRGDTIAKVGSTGNSTGPHCHFEVRKNGAYVDPMPWLKGN